MSATDKSCQHLARRIIPLDIDSGSIGLELSVCDNPLCADIKTVCEHVQADWLPDMSGEQRLICRFCEKDCT